MTQVYSDRKCSICHTVNRTYRVEGMDPICIECLERLTTVHKKYIDANVIRDDDTIQRSILDGLKFGGLWKTEPFHIIQDISNSLHCSMKRATKILFKMCSQGLIVLNDNHIEVVNNQ